MKYIDYNGTKISKLSLGTVQFGLNYGVNNSTGQPLQDDVNEIINYVSSQGINCFDTAQAYGSSEVVLGRSLRTVENRLVISKLKSNLFQDNVKSNIETSLKNLKLDRLYGLLLHDSDLLYNWSDELSQSVNKLLKENKIEYFGVSIYTNDDFELALSNSSIKFIQIPFNIFDQRAVTENWFKKAKENNKLLFIRSIFLQGLLLMDLDKLPNNLKKAKEPLLEFSSYCKELNMSKSEVALSFVDTIAVDSLLLFGCDNIAQAKENIVNYKNLQPLSNDILEKLILKFQNIDEEIYNPTKW